jgi:hypothetical protein
LITPVLLSQSSSGVYFLFGGASILTVGVCTVFMPETRGNSLEAIGESFLAHSAKEIVFVRALRALASRIGRLLGGEMWTGTRMVDVVREPQGIEVEVLTLRAPT